MKKKYPYYPIYLDIEDRAVLIVGGGSVCARKAETMMRYGARVTVVATEASGEIAAWAAEGALTLRARPYDEEDLEGQSLVIASTDDSCTNARVARDCRRRRIPVNVVDVTHLCEFIVPAIVDQGSVHIAISTEGKSPARCALNGRCALTGLSSRASFLGSRSSWSETIRPPQSTCGTR